MNPQEEQLSSTIVFRMVESGVWAATLHSNKGFMTVEAFALDDALVCLLEAAPTMG